VVEYRLGVKSKRKNDLWHFHPDCESYPTKTFAIRQQKPLDDYLCSPLRETCGRCENDSGLIRATRPRANGSKKAAKSTKVGNFRNRLAAKCVCLLLTVAPESYGQ